MAIRLLFKPWGRGTGHFWGSVLKKNPRRLRAGKKCLKFFLGAFGDGHTHPKNDPGGGGGLAEGTLAPPRGPIFFKKKSMPPTLG